MCRSLDIRQYKFSKGEPLLIDTCVWLYLFGPLSSPDWRADVYSKAYQRMLSIQCDIRTDVIVIAEYINRYAKLEFRYQERSGYSDFDLYKKSDDFKARAGGIVTTVTRISGRTNKHPFNFDNIDLPSLLTAYRDTHPDFNDLLLWKLCDYHDMKLVTHDAGFASFDIDVLTANRTLLQLGPKSGP